MANLLRSHPTLTGENAEEREQKLFMCAHEFELGTHERHFSSYVHICTRSSSLLTPSNLSFSSPSPCFSSSSSFKQIFRSFSLSSSPHHFRLWHLSTFVHTRHWQLADHRCYLPCLLWCAYTLVHAPLFNASGNWIRSEDAC